MVHAMRSHPVSKSSHNPNPRNHTRIHSVSLTDSDAKTRLSTRKVGSRGGGAALQSVGIGGNTGCGGGCAEVTSAQRLLAAPWHAYCVFFDAT